MSKRSVSPFRLWLVGVVSLALLLGCRLSPPPSAEPLVATVATATPRAARTIPTLATTFTPEPDWDRRWLHDVPCAVPCWEGITPGQTLASDALRLLRANPLIRRAHIYSDTLILDYGMIEWDWFNETAGGQAIFDAQAGDSPITVIRPYLVDRLSWQEVLDRFGEPSGISTFGGRGPDIDSPVVFDVIVVYAEQGLVLYTDGLRHPPVLSPALRFDNISLYAAPLDDLGAVLPYFKLYPEHLRPWEGFQDFLYYCPVEDNPDCLADN